MLSRRSIDQIIEAIEIGRISPTIVMINCIKDDASLRDFAVVDGQTFYDNDARQISAAFASRTKPRNKGRRIFLHGLLSLGAIALFPSSSPACVLNDYRINGGYDVFEMRPGVRLNE